MLRLGVVTGVVLALLAAPSWAAHAPPAGAGAAPTGQAQPPRTKGGPCTKAASRSMPEGEGHDHANLAQHAFRCRVKQVFHDSLENELGARNDVVFGEMDVKRDLAAVSVTYPEAGFVLFDVKNPAKPQFLSWYRGSECEGLIYDVNCGAFVDISAKGDVVFIAVQSLSIVPGAPRLDNSQPFSTPGVEMVDIRDRKNPQLLQVYPVVSQGGVHTARSHIVPDNSKDDGPREPGEYVFSIANGTGIDIARITRSGGAGGSITMEPWSTIFIAETHDTYMQNDPISGRTYMYVAGGREMGFYVFDVTDPGDPRPVAAWDVTPECYSDWYGHTIDVTYRGKRRYVTLPTETFNAGEISEEEKAAGCGTVYGNADKSGVMWIVDASDWSKLGKFNYTGEGETDVGENLAKKSKATLVTTWSNPAGRAGGNLIFSPHNQQIVGNRIYLSHFHGGVYVLDASKAFAGKKKAPVEVGFVVPNAGGRPFYEPPVPPTEVFFTDTLGIRPMMWDAYWYKGHILSADMVGGFYSHRWAGDRPKRKR